MRGMSVRAALCPRKGLEPLVQELVVSRWLLLPWRLLADLSKAYLHVAATTGRKESERGGRDSNVIEAQSMPCLGSSCLFPFTFLGVTGRSSPGPLSATPSSFGPQTRNLDSLTAGEVQPFLFHLVAK